MNPSHPINPMKTLPRLASLAAVSVLAAVASASAATPTVCPPYTFVGRITDSRHVAFDNQEVATLRAYDANSKLIAAGKTFFRDDTTRNYALQIPMASSPVDGCALLGDIVSVTAEADGRIWSGVIDPAVIGTPGTVSVVDIVLANDADGDGIDDDLYAELEALWQTTSAYDPAIAYKPALIDSDGDGVSDLGEALQGTDPSNPGDVLAIREFSASPVSITFDSPGGHSFAVEQATTLDAADWTPVPLSTDPAAKSSSRTLYSIPTSSKSPSHTLYLFPTSSPAFFRLAPQ